MAGDRCVRGVQACCVLMGNLGVEGLRVQGLEECFQRGRLKAGVGRVVDNLRVKLAECVVEVGLMHLMSCITHIG